MTARIPVADLERRLIAARDSFDRQIESLEADLARHPGPRGATDDRERRLAKYRSGRERCEELILRGYPEG